MTARPPARRARFDVASRVVAAVAGGYAVAALAAVALGTLLPAPRIGAAIQATFIGIAIVPFAAIGVFAARSAGRAWAGIVLAGLGCAGAALLGGWRP